MKSKFLIYWVFVIAGSILVVTFLTATTYTQLIIATLFYPPIAYFLFKSFPAGARKSSSSIEPAVTVMQPVNEPVSETVDVADTDKRAFLKLIGSVGLSYFLFSLFSRRPETMFLGRALDSGSGSATLEDTKGNKIDPAQRQPTDGYQISEIEEGEQTYCGYTNNAGGWFIMEQNSETGSFRYAKGDRDFPVNWTRRETQKYDYFHNVFS